ncbi:MAG: bifunctional oligoribonuclease/PAP phosphatase NrnA [Clostridiales bacterium]|nr:bifunctional oligoribonuclease/PAP phosphatase NrnA [Clostridiales bacterium]
MDKSPTLLSVQQTSRYLIERDNYIIITHANPDGDTCGSAAALCAALRKLGKTAHVLPNSTITDRYHQYIRPYLIAEDMDASFYDTGTVVTVDVADTALFSKEAEPFSSRVDLCIDHHPSNRRYSKYLLLDADAAAAGELILDLICDIGIELDGEIALPLYLAIATDTGCFRFSNTTPRTFRAAARLLETGIDFMEINTSFFDTRSKTRLLIEQKIFENLRYYNNETTALAVLTKKLMSDIGAKEEDVENLSSFLRSIEGVNIGVLIRERENDTWKISVRTGPGANASNICMALGGGGHERAAGCTYTGTLEDAVSAILQSIETEIRSNA